MSEGSFKVGWFAKSGAKDNGFDPDDGLYKHSKNGTVNRIECKLGGPFTLARKSGKPLAITFALNAADVDVLQLWTRKSGRHLSMAFLRDFDPSASADGLQHPDVNAKIKSVTFHNVGLATGSLPAGVCTQTGDKVVCNTETVTGPKEVKLTVCLGGCQANTPSN